MGFTEGRRNKQNCKIKPSDKMIRLAPKKDLNNRPKEKKQPWISFHKKETPTHKQHMNMGNRYGYFREQKWY